MEALSLFHKMVFVSCEFEFLPSDCVWRGRMHSGNMCKEKKAPGRLEVTIYYFTRGVFSDSKPGIAKLKSKIET
jgi:hypothetical protein